MPVRHVLIDGYFLGKPYGFGRFIFELCRALGRARSELELTVAVPAGVDAKILPSYAGLAWHRLPDANFIIWEQILIPKLARRLACDVIHFPYNTRAFFTRGVRSVTTVHDLLFLKEVVPLSPFKSYISSKYSKLVFRSVIGKSDTIIAVSKTTQSFLAQLGYPSVTVYNTVDGFLENGTTANGTSARPYMLHRGDHVKRRNTERVILAFLRARQSIPHVDLKIVGVPRGAEIWPMHADPAIHFLPRLSDAELAGLYAASSCVIATSLQEGFGFPIIEAFGFGSPVITSRVDPMMEIAGDAAILVDPYNVADIAQAMVSLITDRSRAQALVAKGRARIEIFASARVAEQICCIYRSCKAPAP